LGQKYPVILEESINLFLWFTFILFPTKKKQIDTENRTKTRRGKKKTNRHKNGT